jgi:multidrug efflux pump subunit AcrA (membrane-fusion protein)
MIPNTRKAEGLFMLVPATHKLAVAIASLPALLPAFALAQTPSRATPAQTAMQLGVAATGVIEKIFVRDGDHVDAGQLLVTIDCRPLQAEIKVRGANVAAAEVRARPQRPAPRRNRRR